MPEIAKNNQPLLEITGLKKYYPIQERTTITEIYANMNEVIPKLFGEALDMIEQSGYAGERQSKNAADL